jgi:TP901 family phage tail tape measure protein
MTEVDPIDILLRIGNLRKFVAEAEVAGGAILEIGDAAVKSDKKAAGAMSGLGLSTGGLKKIIMGTAGAVAAIGYETTKMSIVFKSEMLKLHTQAGASLGEVKWFEKSIENVKGLQQSAGELAKGLYAFVSVGLKGKTAMAALVAASHGAAVGGAHLEETTNALAAAMVAFEIKGKNAGKTMGTINAIVGVGKLRMEDLVSSFRQGILPVAQLGGLGLRSLGAALAVMTDRGITASRGMQYLRQAIFYLASESTGPAKKALGELGLTSEQVAKTLRKPDGIAETVKLLHERMKGMSNSKVLELLKALGGGARSSSGLAAVYQSLGSQVSSVQGKYSKIGGIEGTFHQKVMEQEHTTLGMLKNDWSEVTKAMVRVGPIFEHIAVILAKGLTVIIKGVLGFFVILTELGSIWNGLSGPVKAILMLVGLFIGQAVLLATVVKAWRILTAAIETAQIVFMYFGDAVKAFFVTDPIILGLMAVVAITILVITHWKQTKAIFMEVFSWVSSHWQILADFLTGGLAEPVILIVKHWKGLMSFFEGLPKVFEKVFEAIGKFVMSPFEWAIHGVGKLWKKFTKIPGIGTAISIGSKVLGAISNPIGAVGSALGIPGAAQGGTILSTGSVLVGEAGPEILNLPAGASVKPLSNSGGEGFGDNGPVFVSKTELYLEGKMIDEAVGKYTASKLARR